MKVKTAYSTNANVKDAVAELKETLNDDASRLVLYFASSSYGQAELVNEMNSSFSSTRLLGCTTAGEIVSGKMLKNSIVAMSLGDEIIDDVELVIIENISNLKSSFSGVEARFNKKINELEHDKYFGIVLADGLSGIEETLMDELGNLSDIIFIGGSAGDDLKFKNTYLFNSSHVVQNGAVIAVIKSKVKFGFIKTQSFSVLDTKLVATKVDEKNREVIEFNNIPAVEYYADILNVKEEDVAGHFMDHPVGLVINNDPYVRSPQRVIGSTMKFFCNIKEGMELSLLESGDIVMDTQKALDNYIEENGAVSALINFNCILRTLELESKNQCEGYGNIFSSIPTIGFSTYGEEYIGHVNQTATIIAFS